VLATIAIGENYLKPFLEYALHTWQMYAERHELGIIVFDEDLIPRDHPKWKNPYWQKFLIPQALGRYDSRIKRITCLDTDILISPLAPDIFGAVDPDRVGVVSKRFGLPYPREDVLRRVAFLRHHFFDKRYPLDSSLFASIPAMYQNVGLDPQEDDVNSGVFCLTLSEHGDLFTDLFDCYDRSKTELDAWEQIFFNHFIFSRGLAQRIDYRFNCLWILEAAWKYPSIYEAPTDTTLARQAIESSLWTNYFVHFAGSWHESKVWKRVRCLVDETRLAHWTDFESYLKIPLSGDFVGSVRPSTA
jgi:hypothetical protein